MGLYIALQGYALHLQRVVMLVHDLQSMLKLFNRQFPDTECSSALALPCCSSAIRTHFAASMTCCMNGQHADSGLVALQGFFGTECENEALALEYNKSVTKAEASFEYDYYSLPEVQASELENTVEVKVQASFSSSAASYWVARPELLLLKAGCFLMSCHVHKTLTLFFTCTYCVRCFKPCFQFVLCQCFAACVLGLPSPHGSFYFPEWYALPFLFSQGSFWSLHGWGICPYCTGV